MTKLFISYARADHSIIYTLTQELRDLGFTVWIDVSGIKGGTAWSSEIVKAVMDCDFFLLFISSASIHSDSVRREVDLAYKNKKSLIPLRLEKVDIPLEWEYQTIGVQWLECSEQDWKSSLLVALGHSQPGVANIVSQSVSKPPENIAIQTIPENLPPRVEFVGRKAEKELLHKSLRSNSKVIGVDGMGGIGKTSLALEIAHECLVARQENLLPNTVAKFDGFIWVDARDRELKLKDLLDSIALTLQRRDIVRQKLDELDEKEIIRGMLQKKPYLLIIDNLEIKLDDRLHQFLLELPDPSKTLITSRNKLELLVQEGTSISLQGLHKTEAFALIQKAGERIGLQKLVDAGDEVLLQIVQATGGAPLAIKWAIGQMKQKGQSLDSVLRSIRAARGGMFKDIVKGSWDLLSDGAKKVLRVLGLFVESASRSAVEAGSNIRDLELDDAIGQLVEMSLADATDELDSSSQRFSIHQLTKNFVLEGLGRDSEEMENEARERIANYYLNLVTRYFPRTSNISDTEEYKGVSRLVKYRAFVEQGDSQNQRRDYSQLEVDMENIVSSVDWCFRNQKNEMLIDFSLTLTVFFELQGHAEASIRHGENAIKRAKDQNDLAAVALLGRFPVGWFYYVSGNLEAAKQKSKESIKIFEQFGDALYLAATKRLLGLTLLRQKDLIGAQLALEEGIEIARQHSVENEQIAYCLIHLGDVMVAKAENEKAHEIFTEAYEMFQRLDYEPGITSSLDQLANIERVLMHWDLAAKQYEELKRLSNLLGKERGLGHYHWGIGLIHKDKGEYDQAKIELEEALVIYKRLGLRPRVEETEISLAEVNRELTKGFGDKILR